MHAAAAPHTRVSFSTANTPLTFSAHPCTTSLQKRAPHPNRYRQPVCVCVAGKGKDSGKGKGKDSGKGKGKGK